MQDNNKEAGEASATLTSLPIRPLGPADPWHKHVTLVNFWIPTDSSFALHAQREVCITFGQPTINIPSGSWGYVPVFSQPNPCWQNLPIKAEMKNTSTVFLNN